MKFLDNDCSDTQNVGKLINRKRFAETFDYFSTKILCLREEKSEIEIFECHSYI